MSSCSRAISASSMRSLLLSSTTSATSTCSTSSCATAFLAPIPASIGFAPSSSTSSSCSTSSPSSGRSSMRSSLPYSSMKPAESTTLTCERGARQRRGGGRHHRSGGRRAMFSKERYVIRGQPAAWASWKRRRTCAHAGRCCRAESQQGARAAGVGVPNPPQARAGRWWRRGKRACRRAGGRFAHQSWLSDARALDDQVVVRLWPRAKGPLGVWREAGGWSSTRKARHSPCHA